MKTATMTSRPISLRHSRQRGSTIVEFAFIVVMFLTLLFGIVEFGRLFFHINSVQEVTRRAAREQVVRWMTATDTVQRMAVLQPGSTGVVYYPGANDITQNLVELSFHTTYANAANPANGSNATGLASAQANLNNCVRGQANCIRFVRARMRNGNALANFNMLVPFMPSSVFPMPDSTVIMPAEALGLL